MGLRFLCLDHSSGLVLEQLHRTTGNDHGGVVGDPIAGVDVLRFAIAQQVLYRQVPVAKNERIGLSEGCFCKLNEVFLFS